MLRVVQLLALLALLALCSAEALLGAPDGVDRPQHAAVGAGVRTQKLARRQMKDSHFWQPTGET